MFCSCEMSSNCIWLQIIFRSVGKRNHASPSSSSSPEQPQSNLAYKTTWRGDENAPSFDRPRQTWWSNEKTIIKLDYRKISWSVSVLQIDQLFASAFGGIGGGFVWPTRKWARVPPISAMPKQNRQLRIRRFMLLLFCKFKTKLFVSVKDQKRRKV